MVEAPSETEPDSGYWKRSVDYIGKLSDRCYTAVCHISTPTGYGALAGVMAGWYGRRVAQIVLTAALTQWCIVEATERLGNETLGKYGGFLILAPLVVPSLVTLLSTVASVAVGYITIVFTNLVYPPSQG